MRAQPIRTCHAEASWSLPSLAQGQIKARLSSSGGSQSGGEQQLFPQQNLPAWIHPLMGSSLPLETVREHLQCWHGPHAIEGGSRASQRGDPPSGPSGVKGRTRVPIQHTCRQSQGNLMTNCGNGFALSSALRKRPALRFVGVFFFFFSSLFSFIY